MGQKGRKSKYLCELGNQEVRAHDKALNEIGRFVITRQKESSNIHGKEGKFTIIPS